MAAHGERYDRVGRQHVLPRIGELEEELLGVVDGEFHLFDIGLGIQRLVLVARGKHDKCGHCQDAEERVVKIFHSSSILPIY